MRTGAFVWSAAVIVVAAAGFTTGWLIKGGGNPDFAFDTKAPAYQGADLPGGRSRAGFTGFGDQGGLSGATIVAGKVTAVSADSVTLETPAGTSTIRVTGQEKLRILEQYSGAIAAGATVFVSVKPDTDEAQAVLVLIDP